MRTPVPGAVRSQGTRGTCRRTCAQPAPHQVDITEAVEPEVVQGMGGERQLLGEEAALTLSGGVGQAAQDPGIHGGCGAQLQGRRGCSHRRT